MTFTIYSEPQSRKPVRIRFVSAAGTEVFMKNIGGKSLMLGKP